MKKNSVTGLHAIIYRIRRYPSAAIFSAFLVVLLIAGFCYLLERIFPDVTIMEKFVSAIGINHNEQYHFYTGQKGGAYYAIGEAAQGKFAEDGDVVINVPTSGGAENAMRLTTEECAFGLVDEDLFSHDEELKKNVKIIAPIFLERMHVFYRGDLFSKCKKAAEIQLSANTDPEILKTLSHSVKKVNVGLVGSGTRMMASYVLALLDRQISSARLEPLRYQEVDEEFGTAFEKMQNYSTRSDSTTDLVFYMGADPIDMVQLVLDCNKYKLMSINPSFVVQLNKEYNLNLRISDFKKKYDSAARISTMSALCYLITSKGTLGRDVLSFLKKIDSNKADIHMSLIHLPPSCKYSCYKSSDSCKYQLPLVEFGFFNSFSNEYKEAMKLDLKEIAALALSVITLFFPVFRSVLGFSSKLRFWAFNKRIDDILHRMSTASVKQQPVMAYETYLKMSALKGELTDIYGNGEFSEQQFNALNERIKQHLEYSIKMVPADELQAAQVIGQSIPASS